MKSRINKFILAIEDIFLKSPSEVISILEYHHKYVSDPKLKDILIKSINLHKNDNELFRYFNRYLSLVQCENKQQTVQKDLFISNLPDDRFPNILWSEPLSYQNNWIAEEIQETINSHLKNQPLARDSEWWELLPTYYEYTWYFSLGDLNEKILNLFDKSNIAPQHRIYLSSLLLDSNVIKQNRSYWEKESLKFLECLEKIITFKIDLLDTYSMIPEDLFFLKFSPKVIKKMYKLGKELESEHIQLSYDSLELFSFIKCIQNRDDPQLIENPSKFLVNTVGKGMDKSLHAIEGLIYASQSPFFDNKTQKEILYWLFKKQKKIYDSISPLASVIAFAYLYNDITLFDKINKLRNKEWKNTKSLFGRENNNVLVRTQKLPNSLDFEKFSLMVFSILESMERYNNSVKTSQISNI